MRATIYLRHEQGYLPLPTHLRTPTLTRKREEYASLVELAFARGREGLDQQIWHQIEIDVPRTRPGVQLWMQAATQRVSLSVHFSYLSKISSWSRTEPREGIVRLGHSASRKWIRARHQRPCDSFLPSLFIFLHRYVPLNSCSLRLTRLPSQDSDPELFDPACLPPNVLNAVEADSFWCLSRLLDGIQDNYIHGQPGIHRGVKRIAELVARIDGEFRRPKAGERELTDRYCHTNLAPLAAHLESENVEFMQFAFRWMNCLLMREISVQNTIRMWDTYLVSTSASLSALHWSHPHL